MYLLNNPFCGDYRIQFIQYMFTWTISPIAPYWIQNTLQSIVESMDREFILKYDDSAIFDLLTLASERSIANNKKCVSLVNLCKIIDAVRNLPPSISVEVKSSIWRFLESISTICMSQSDGATYSTSMVMLLGTMEELHTIVIGNPSEPIFRGSISCLYVLHCEYTQGLSPPPSLTPFPQHVKETIDDMQRRDPSFIGSRMDARLNEK